MRCSIKYFYDTEFLDTGSTIDLVSIGIVCEDGRELYAQHIQFNPNHASQWVKENVFPHLLICPRVTGPTTKTPQLAPILRQHSHGQCLDIGLDIRYVRDCPWRTRAAIQREILSFMNVERHGTPELWGYYSAYDHVAFCQIFGTMMDLPKGYPMYTRDIKQLADSLNVQNLPEQGDGEHNALADARHNKVMYDFLEPYTWKD